MSDQPLEEQVLHRVENRVSWITLNRPEVRNAITPDQRERVIELLEAASARGRSGRWSSPPRATGSAPAPTCGPAGAPPRPAPKALPTASWGTRRG